MKVVQKIDSRNKAAKLFLAYAKELSFVSVQQEINDETKRAISDARKGKDVYKVKNSKQLFKELGI